MKNGKSQITAWFPLGDQLEDIMRRWIDELYAVGFRADDALFPPDDYLSQPRTIASLSRPPTEPWKTDDGIRRAFNRGCAAAGLPYFNPHSARHYLKLVRDEFCRSAQERQALSYNMGHENEQTTEADYAKMTDQRRDELFGKLSAGNVETEEEKDLLLAYHDHELIPGTPEHDRAEQLWGERRRRRLERRQASQGGHYGTGPLLDA